MVGTISLSGAAFGNPIPTAPENGLANVTNTIENLNSEETIEIKKEIVEVETRKLTTKEKVQDYFSDIPVMIQVAACESEFRQHDQYGNLLRGRVDSGDVGVMQINERYHLETAKKLDLDVHTLEGNLAYARYLYSKEGTRPWNASAPCWSNAREVALR